MRTSIDQQRHASGVESICRPIQVAPSGYWLYAAQQRNPELRCAPIQCAEVLSTEIERVWLYCRADHPVSLKLDGRENVGLIARKPS